MSRHQQPAAEWQDHARTAAKATGRSLRWLWVSVVLVIALSVAGTFAYNRYFGADQAVRNQDALDENQRQHDRETDTAAITVVAAGDMTPGWASSAALDVDAHAPDWGFPGTEDAAQVGAPTAPDALDGSTTVAIVLSGQHYQQARLTEFTLIVDSRTQAPAGTAFFWRGQGDSPMGGVGFDVAKDALEARILKGPNEVSTDKYLQFRNVTLMRDDPSPPSYRALVIAPPDTDLRYHFHFSFDNGKSQDLYNTDGKPFRLVTYPTHAQRGYTLAHVGSYNGETVTTPCGWPAGCQSLAQGLIG